jgi:TolB protein
MNMKKYLLIPALLLLAACQQKPVSTETPEVKDSLVYPGEEHFRNMRQLTFGGDNAEAYWSYDDKSLVFQRKYEKDGVNCDQIFIGNVPAPGQPFEFKMVSTGMGRTTCSYFLGGDSLIVYSSTHLKHDSCPEVPQSETGSYVWPLYPEFEIFIADRSGNIREQLTSNNYYDAEPTLSPDGKLMVFTSTRTGDLELYVMNMETREVKQITSELGYDGGAFFSPDGSKIVYRASRPETPEKVAKYKELLKRNMVSPSEMEIWVCDVDGGNKKQITSLGGANWAPYFHPSGQKIIFSSNHKTKGYQFNLYMVNIDGSGLKQITFDKTFDAFPMFSRDGKYLVFASNRNNQGTRDTNLFLVEWVE